MSRCGVSGKRSYPDYGTALAALVELEERSHRPGIGSAYQCSRCGQWHISSRKFTIARRRGRGKSRRGLLEDVG